MSENVWVINEGRVCEFKFYDSSTCPGRGKGAIESFPGSKLHQVAVRPSDEVYGSELEACLIAVQEHYTNIAWSKSLCVALLNRASELVANDPDYVNLDSILEKLRGCKDG